METLGVLFGLVVLVVIIGKGMDANRAYNLRMAREEQEYRLKQADDARERRRIVEEEPAPACGTCPNCGGPKRLADSCRFHRCKNPLTYCPRCEEEDLKNQRAELEQHPAWTGEI